TVYARDAVMIELPAPEMLLAMKIDASQRRGRRDGLDIPYLLAGAGITRMADAERLYEEFYPGDELTPRTYRILQGAVTSSKRLDVTVTEPEEIGAQIDNARRSLRGQ